LDKEDNMLTHRTTEALLRVLNAPRRNHFFYGKRMDVQHFEMEQSYGKLKQWLLNRVALGKGVLCGLRVFVDGRRVCVDPGVAIDGMGREIIVPVRTCIDAVATDDGCCSGHRESAVRPAPENGVYTLWACYHECLTDQQPVLVSECGTRDHCAAGTVVESFCLKITPGLPPLQHDPDWCARLWPKKTDGGSNTTDIDRYDTGISGITEADAQAIRDTLNSRRHLLCELLDWNCEAPDTDPCVPLAIVIVRGDRIVTESCLVRPRIYSNATLLDLILCLAEKIDDCCNKHETPTETMRVRSVDFVSRSGGAPEQPVASMLSPLQDTAVNIDDNPNAIRIRFSKPFAQDQHKPTTHGLNDPDFTRHNVQVVPETPLNNLAYVPGTLTIEGPDTMRFDLLPESPYRRQEGGWQKGRYFILLRGTENLPANQQALADLNSAALDGEAIAPSPGGSMSGNGTAGGDFKAPFVIGTEVEPQETIRVRSVEFLAMEDDVLRVIRRVESPLDRITINTQEGLRAIRVQFTKPYAQDAHVPTTHASGDADPESHNVQVLTVNATGAAPTFVPGGLQLIPPDTIIFVLNIPGRRTRGPRPWPVGTFRLFLRGNDVSANRPAITDLNGASLDGEPSAPANGVISGDGVAGGDFVTDFTVQAGD
jgi:hypothetical protein